MSYQKDNHTAWSQSFQGMRDSLCALHFNACEQKEKTNTVSHPPLPCGSGQLPNEVSPASKQTHDANSDESDGKVKIGEPAGCSLRHDVGTGRAESAMYIPELLHREFLLLYRI